MAGSDWNIWVKKKVFIRLNNKKVFSGIIIDVFSTNELLVWITLIDKYKKRVTILHTEIVEIKEEN